MATKLQIKRLKKLINFLENVVHKSKFDLDNWVKGDDPKKMAKNPSKVGDCGTSACVVGWFPHLFPRMAKWPDADDADHNVGDTVLNSYSENFQEKEIFQDVTGLSLQSTCKIIYTQFDYINNYGKNKYGNSINPTAKTVAKKIRKLARQEGIEI